MRFVTLDVFSDRPFGGNPLAVVLDGDGIDPQEMQQIAAEFRHSETAFVCSPTQRGFDAKVRIFTPTRELDFAGHPNVGAALVLAEGDRSLRFEERIGAVSVDVRGSVAEVTGPKPFKILGSVEREAAAAVCGLLPSMITHLPVVASCGTAFLMAEVKSPEQLQQARPVAPYDSRGAIGTVLFSGRDPIQARVFIPAATVREDPATGSGALVLAGLLAQRDGAPGSWTIEQGLKLGRPSVLNARGDGRGKTWVSGTAVEMMRGTLTYR